jgi:hypothetical protein
MAPEQEALQSQRGKADSSPYSTQADMFSLGVILFEMFSPPFSTYMERAGILTTLRGDRADGHGSNSQTTQSDDKPSDFDMKASQRFPASFIQTVPINARRLILWCLERDPSARPSAEDLLASDFLPRKIELEQRYLEEALELITNSQSESYNQILEALFNKPTLDVVELTFDTDVAVKANNVALETGDKRQRSPPEALIKAIGDIRAGAIDPLLLRSLAMSTSSLMAATAALKRARITGYLGKGGKGMLKRSTQRTAGVLAMRAATAAAVTGSLDGVHGADPTVVEVMCDKLRSIFRSHGAVHLRSPLLRPKSHATSSQGGGLGGPAEVMNGRGAVLLLPEDLTAPFARALGRGGAATSHLKRYDIDRVYHRSLIGGHPRESIEASFDVVVEDHSKARQLEAETIMICSQVMAILPTRPSSTKLPFGARSPMWYLRISNTRLADAIVELCGVPSKESARRVCFHILSRFTAPPPGSLHPALNSQKKSQNRNKGEAFTRSEELSTALTEAVSEHGVSKESADKLRLFIESCSPVSPDIHESIESIKRAITKIKSVDDPKSASKREKRFEDAAKSLRSLQDLCSVLWPNLEPLLSSQGSGNNSLFNRPLYMSLDLGLRQRRKHYHGGVIFQAIVLQDNFFESFSDPAEHNELIVSASGRGMKIAEGGEFSDLVRKYRPPGNFATTFLSYYTAAPIPMCAGVRIAVGKLIELVYLDAALSSHGIQDSYAGIDTDNTGIETLRQYLGHPLSYTTPIQCIVASANGMDAASAPERFIVASRLWAEGVSAEYLTHSGVMLSLCKRLRREPGDGSGASDWSLVELFGVCALLKIPFVVLVQAHLLKEKNSVRLRRIGFDSLTQGSNSATGNEMFVSLDDLASTIQGDLGKMDETEDPADLTTNANAGSREHRSHRASQIDCILVDNDVYYGIDREISKSETPHWKTHMKSVKKAEMACEAYLTTLQDATHQPVLGMQGMPVFAVEISFWTLRDFGTALMRRERQDQSAMGAVSEIAERYPKHKRPLKTLGVAIDSYMKRYGVWGGRDNPRRDGAPSLLTLLLYSRLDDRCDVVTLCCSAGNGRGVSHLLSSKRK